jgi:hypothetical protein
MRKTLFLICLMLVSLVAAAPAPLGALSTMAVVKVQFEKGN